MTETSQPLARVTGDLDAARGPDVTHAIVVPRSWLDEGGQIHVRLPRRLSCSACQGGGCDRCGRTGALALVEPGDEPNVVSCSLPVGAPAALCLRLPMQGANSEDDALPRGHLLLTIQAGPEPSSGVTRDVAEGGAGGGRLAERKELIVRSVVLALVLVFTFFGLLRLSGWM